jgi:hypothetical protein
MAASAANASKAELCFAACELAERLSTIADEPAMPPGEQYEPALGVALALDARP